MNIKNLFYAFVAFILPGLILISGAMAKIYNAWLYVGCITWLVMALIIYLSFDKS